MRKVFAIAAMGLLVLTLPALAAVPATTDDASDHGSAGPRTGPSGECLPTLIVWDSGMYDEFTPPTGCSSAGSAGCMVNADTTGTGAWPGDFGRRLMADDWIALDQDSDGIADPVTDVKIWIRANAAAEELGYIGDNPAPMLHGFCVDFYEAVDAGGSPYCPDGSVTGEAVIGTHVYSQYASSFVHWNVTTGLTRNHAYCVTLPVAFYPTLDKWYWVAVSPDFDFQYAATAAAYSQVFDRVWPGLGISVCEVMWWDGWNYGSDAPWVPLSVGVNLSCWANWDLGFKLYSGTPPVATEPTTWGRIKANYR